MCLRYGKWKANKAQFKGDFAAGCQAALDCVNTKQSQEFVQEVLPIGIHYFTGALGVEETMQGSHWDDFCGEGRKMKGGNLTHQYLLSGFE